MLERVEVIAEIPVHPCRHLEPGRDEEPADAADAPDQDVPGDEPDEVAELELAHQVEDGAGQHRAQRVRRDGGGDDRVRLVVPDYVGNGGRHVVEEGHDFDLVVC